LKVTVLGSSKLLKWKPSGEGINISLPENLAAEGEHVWVLKAQQ
jgi:hypothetical protein